MIWTLSCINRFMISFKQFLTEGAPKAHRYSSRRATAEDIIRALEFVSKAVSVPVTTLKGDLIGSARLALVGKKQDAGDIDIAFKPADSADAEMVNGKMLKAVKGRGAFNAGTKVGSYSVPIKGGFIQVDLMFVSNKKWAKWMYHSSHESKYPGAVRNIILFTALAHSQEKDKDFVIRDNGKPIIRASKSVKMDSGMERLFKMAKFNKKAGTYNKSLEKVDPKAIEAHLRDIGQEIKFSHESDLTDNPDHVAAHIFGHGVTAKDLMTAEDVINRIHQLPNAKEIIQASRSELKRLKLPIPAEL